MMKQVNIQLPIRMLTLMLGLFLSVGAFAQISVKGHVKDATGEDVIGATVRVLGTSTATVTDFDGNFTVKANQGQDIQVTYMGYQPATVKAAPTVEIVLQDDQTILNDVVVIGYGRARKSDLTGSVTAIKPDEKNHGLNTNAQDMIQGKIAGVNVITDGGTPGGSAQIRIRGGSSLNASNDPLIVIDGLAMDTYGVQGLANPLSMVNPNDIESFTVLKDASATAIYGSRASNGVIIITTKKGRTGQAPKVTYDFNVSLSKVKDYPDVLSGTDFANYVKTLYGEDSDAYRALGWYDNNGTQHIEDTDWQEQLFRTALSNDHNVTVTGGLKNMPYRVSFGYTNQEGIIRTSEFERYTASVNLSPSLLQDHLKLNLNAKGMIANNRYADGGAIGAARWMDPTKPVKANSDVFNKFFGGYTQWYMRSAYPGESTWTYTKPDQGTANPASILDMKNDKATSKTLIGNIEADYAIHGFEDLHLHINGGMDISTGKQNTNVSPYSYSNNYYGYTGWNKKNTYNLQLSMYAQYMKDLNKANHFDIMAGYEWQHFHIYTDWYGHGTYPDSNTLYAGQKFNAPDDQVTESKSENYLVSFFGRLNYSLLDRYLVTFTLRDDGSSRFSKGNKWGLFPSVAIGWRIKDEAFLKNVDAVSETKLRLGWGITGQQEGIGDYSYIATYTPNVNHAFYPLLDNVGLTYRPDAYNSSLTWEKTTTWNAGLDLGFLNNRIELNFDWYYRKTKDLLNDVYVSAGSNFKPQVKSNIGSLHNTGFEFATTIRPVQTKNWQWEVSYNLTYNQNEIDELVSGEGDNYYVATGGISAGVGGNIQAHSVGHPASSFYVYQQVYDQNGKPIQNTYVDRNGNGYIDNGDKYFYYKPAADVTMGLSSRLQYKNWDLGFSMRASLGNYVYNDNFAGSINVGAGAIYTVGFLGNRMVDAINLGFTNPLTEQFMSDYFVTNASFLKMDNITLGHSFNKFCGLNWSGRIYATVQNVFTLTKYEGVDPEISSGIDNSLYPRPFTTILGMSLNF